MDTGETYIKMCEKAKEIQVHRPAMDFGEWFAFPNKETDEIVAEPVVGDYDGRPVVGDWMYSSPDYLVWLPRQDQLQEMLFKDQKDLSASLPVAVAWLFYNLILKNVNEVYWSAFESLEQLWLAIVMYVLHSSVWCNDTWVRHEETMKIDEVKVWSGGDWVAEGPENA